MIPISQFAFFFKSDYSHKTVIFSRFFQSKWLCPHSKLKIHLSMTVCRFGIDAFIRVIRGAIRICRLNLFLSYLRRSRMERNSGSRFYNFAVLASQLSGILVVVLVAVWMSNYRGGKSSTHTSQSPIWSPAFYAPWITLFLPCTRFLNPPLLTF